jgi:hypothetical protein
VSEAQKLSRQKLHPFVQNDLPNLVEHFTDFAKPGQEDWQNNFWPGLAQDQCYRGGMMAEALKILKIILGKFWRTA